MHEKITFAPIPINKCWPAMGRSDLTRPGTCTIWVVDGPRFNEWGKGDLWMPETWEFDRENLKQQQQQQEAKVGHHKSFLPRNIPWIQALSHGWNWYQQQPPPQLPSFTFWFSTHWLFRVRTRTYLLRYIYVCLSVCEYVRHIEAESSFKFHLNFHPNVISRFFFFFEKFNV